ncbi:MAG: glycosyltransferase family 39 protein [Candidatus Sumerlaeia bacterium]|nr:glycosyltransferase family 39 protein [Candidatus Sumerlaeia bacterium]
MSKLLPPTKSPTDRLLPLLALAPVLLVVLFVAAQPRFAEPRLYDEVIVAHPTADRLTTETLRLSGEWTVTRDGATPAPPGASIHVNTPEGPWSRLQVGINGDVGGKWGIRLSRDFQRHSYLGLIPGEPRDFSAEDLPGVPDGWNPITVEIFPTGEGTHFVNRVMVRFSAEPKFNEPSLPGIIVGAFLPVLLAAFFKYAGRRTARQATLAGGVFGSIAVVLSAWSPETIPYIWAAGTAFALGGASGALFKEIQARRKGDITQATEFQLAFQALALAGILAFGLQVRWDALADAWTLRPSPDALGYLEIAIYGSFYETIQGAAPWIREPLFPAWLRFWFSMAPETTVSARVAGIPIAMAVIALVFFVGRKLFNPWVGLIAAAFYSLNGYTAGQSVMILRDDMLTALFLGMACCALYLREDRWGRAIAWGLVGAGLGLVRVNALFLALAFGGWEAWKRRWHPGEIVLAVALMVVPVVPHLVYNASVSDGDWMYSSNVHTRYYHNLLMLGTEGFPEDFPAWEADPYAGKVVGSSVLLREPSVASAFVRTIRGYIKIFVKDFPHYRLFGGNVLLMVFGLVGFWVLLNRRESWWFYLWTALFLAPVAIIAAIRFDMRLALPAAPAMLMIWGAGVAQVAVWLWEGARRLRERE